MTAPLTAEDFEGFLYDALPGAEGWGIRVDALTDGVCRCRLPADPKHVRPGGSVSGPALFALADTAIYGAVMSRIGLEAMAVTSDLSIRFLRRPPVERDVSAEATLVKLGRRLAVASVELWSGHERARLVAHATGTYALPAA